MLVHYRFARLLAVTMLLTVPCFAVTVARGPFLQLQTPASIHVVWWVDSAATGEVEWGLTNGYGQVAYSPDPLIRHEVEIAGLAPDTPYHYRVRNEGTPLTADATFRTAPAADASAVSFAFVGDSCSEPANATATYNAMLPQSANGFCVTLGDLAGRGEDNVTDYWQSHFFTPAASFIKQICMYPCLGNHELYDEVSYPDFVYPTKYLASWSLPTAGSGTEFYYSFDKGPVHFVALDSWYSGYTAGSAQYNWLAADLAATTQPWKIVYGHLGPYISQLGISDGSTGIRSDLVPLFEQYDVDLNLFGHYHDYQRNELNGVMYILQGTGGQELMNQVDDSQSYVQAYAANIFCFTRLDIDGPRLLGRCLKTSDGTILDAWQLDKPRIGLPWQDTFPPAGPQLNWSAPWHFTTQCGSVATPGNPSGDGYAFAIGDTAGHQFAYPMLAPESLTNYSIQAQVFYDSSSAAKTRWGIGLRGRVFFASDLRSYYTLCFVRNDPLAANGSCLLIRQSAATETVLATWPAADITGWHKLRLAASGTELSVWIDDQLKTTAPLIDATLAKGRPFIYNYRASTAGTRTYADDVLIQEVRGATVLTGFEGYSPDTNVKVAFREPRYSGSTSGDLATSPNVAQVTDNVPAFTGTNCYEFQWQWIDTDPQRWVRLTTSNTPNLPNPAVDFRRPIRFRLRLDAGTLRVCLGLRETGTTAPIGADGGKTGDIEYLGVTSLINGAPQGRLVTAQPGVWQNITFDPKTDPVCAFVGNGILSSPNQRGAIEHLGFSIVDSAGPYHVYIDQLEQLPAPGDYDNDGDLDALDFAEFAASLSGPAGGLIHAGADIFDFDADADVDMHDFAEFQRRFDGG
jgi:hypothetical protein